MSTFPSHCIVRVLAFIDTGISGCSEVIVVGYLCPHCLIQETLFYAIHFVYIVTYFTIGCTDLQIVQPLLRSFHESFVADSPSYGERREETEASASHEVFRTVIAEVDFCQVTVVVAVCGTPYQSLVTFGKVCLITVVILVVQCHSGNVMFAEFSCPVQLEFHVKFISGSLVIAQISKFRVRIELGIGVY